MLSPADNRLITESGRDTPLGQLMRQYWVPVIRSEELRPGGAPVRLTIMGERLVAFRSPDGEVGVMDEACPHRGASLALARNEPCGLRCIYHGWKIAPSGELIEAPTHPASTRLDKLPTRAYPAHRSQGIVWIWLGQGQPPSFPSLAFTELPDDQVLATCARLNCNYLQPLETLWDVFHAQILHNQTNREGPRGDVYFSSPAGAGQGSAEQPAAAQLVYDYPQTRVARTPYGFTFANIDAAKETTHHFIVPFMQQHSITPVRDGDEAMQISVPIDDDHCLLWLIFYNRHGPLKPDGFALSGLGRLEDRGNFLAGMDSRGPDNRWGQDRGAIDRGESYVGVTGLAGIAKIMGEDVLAIESQGRPDRSRESLAPTDRALVEGRNTLLDAVRGHQRGEPPLGRGLDVSRIKAGFVVRPRQAAEPGARKSGVA